MLNETQLNDAFLTTHCHDLIATLLIADGITSIEDAYRKMPNLAPRTVRFIHTRLLFLMGMGENEKTKEKPYPLGTTDLVELEGVAKEAKVPAKLALAAVMRFGNPLERVTAVLTDLRAMIVHGCAPRNPAGLFVHAMRSGENPILPERVLLARQVKGEQEDVRVKDRRIMEALKLKTEAESQKIDAQIDSASASSPQAQWQAFGASLRFLLKKVLSALEMARLEALATTGVLLAAQLHHEAAQAKASGGFETWATGLRGRLI